MQVAASGKRRQLAISHINMKNYANVESTQTKLQLDFKTTTKKITSAKLECTLTCVFLREGKATLVDHFCMLKLLFILNQFFITVTKICNLWHP